MVNNPLARLWQDRCTIYEYTDVVDENTFLTTQGLVELAVDEPCRISFNREQTTDTQNGVAVVSQSVTLFIRPDLKITPGSVIEITRNGVTEKYKGSGKPALYNRHQEIILELYEDEC